MEKKHEEGEQKEEVQENHCKENQTRKSPRHGVCLSPDHGDMQGVKPGNRLDEEQREEKQTLEKGKGFSHNQENRATGSGSCVVKQNIRSCIKGVSNHSSQDKDTERHGDEPRGHGPFYYFGGTNGAQIVSSYFESRGWKRIYNKNREDFKIKWCETKSPANYCNFREGEQLIFQIPNNKVLTTKIGLLSSLREYERVCSKVNHGRGLRRLKMEDFIPTTFRMDVRAEREAFFAQQEGVRNKETPMWICKPTGLNQGRGIFLLRSQEDLAAFKLKLLQKEESQANRKVYHCKPQGRIVQHYIHSPLLLKGKKFDIRSYLLIACTAPFMVFFRHGYARLTCDLYDPNSSNLTAHLTNQYMQKKNPLYSKMKEDTVWSMENFNTYVNDWFSVAKGLPRDWVLGSFTRRMQRIMTQCFFSVKSKLDRRLGVFDLIGCDFMVDEDFKVWLLEMNCNPALHTNCEVLKEVIPSTVSESLDLTFEIFNKRRLGQKLLPLASQREFVLLFNGDFPHYSGPTCKNDKNYEPLRKTPPKIQKTAQKRCKSGMEGKNVFAASSDSCINDVGSVEANGCSNSSQDKASAPFLKSSPEQKASCLQSSSSSSNNNNNIMQTVKRKSLGPRVKLQLSKCPVHLKHSGVRKQSKTR